MVLEVILVVPSILREISPGEGMRGVFLGAGKVLLFNMLDTYMHFSECMLC